jgi:hypothetical protein
MRHPSPFFWSKLGIYRFDSKSARFGVLYTAQTLEGALLEVLGDEWTKSRALSRTQLRQYRMSIILPKSPIKSIDTTGPELNKLGVDSAFFASLNYRVTRSWARAFMLHPSAPEGIIYHSRKNPHLLNFAFFGTDMVQSILTLDDDMLLENAPGLDEVLDKYEVLII